VRDVDRDEEFTEYVVARRPAMKRTARLLTAGDEHAAEDLVQTALTRLYVQWPKLRAARDPVAYGIRTLTNAFLDERRRAHWRREVLAQPVQMAAPSAGEPELRAVVLDALAGLAPRQRAVVILRHFLDLDVAATAVALGCSPGTVKSQNSKALDHLRAVLGPQVLTGGARP